MGENLFDEVARRAGRLDFHEAPLHPLHVGVDGRMVRAQDQAVNRLRGKGAQVPPGAERPGEPGRPLQERSGGTSG